MKPGVSYHTSQVSLIISEIFLVKFDIEKNEDYDILYKSISQFNQTKTDIRSDEIR